MPIDSDFEGTLVLEKLAVAEVVDDFFEAIDADDFERAKSLMTRAMVDPETIKVVLMKMQDSDREH